MNHVKQDHHVPLTPESLTICDREPIHMPGGIQGHGLLLIVMPENMQILQYAGNFSALLGWPALQVGHTLFDFFPDTFIASLQSASPDIPFRVHSGGLIASESAGHQRFDVISHEKNGLLFLEIEPERRSSDAVMLGLLERLVGKLDVLESLDDYLQGLVQCFQEMTGYDRVMFYRFRDDLSGEVVAES
ncbi:MAG: hypothetical protein RIQ52_190, partial [Pseudomonadota bacterium]